MNIVKDYVITNLCLILDRCVGSCNNLNDLSNSVCVNKTGDLNLRVFNMITGINE